MKIKNPEKRLKQFWGKVDKKYIRLIGEWVKGDIVLDVGSGLGSTSGELSEMRNIKCIGIDNDEDALETAKKIYSNTIYLFENSEKLSFPDNYFDSIILRDVLHHLKNESDFDKVKQELVRVSKQGARLIILDPNINFIIKTCRKLMKHEDGECTYEEALQILNDMNWKVKYSNFNTLFSLPLSGGYVGLSMVPNIDSIQKIILSLEGISEKVINRLNLGRFFCWRYLIVAEIIKK